MSDVPADQAVIEAVLRRMMPALDSRIDQKIAAAGAARPRWRINLAPVRFLLDRLSEASSYAGLGVILGLVGFSVTDEQTAVIIKSAAGVSSFLAILLKGGAAGDSA